MSAIRQEGQVGMVEETLDKMGKVMGPTVVEEVNAIVG